MLGAVCVYCLEGKWLLFIMFVYDNFLCSSTMSILLLWSYAEYYGSAMQTVCE